MTARPDTNDHPDSWYAATAKGLTSYPALRGSARADVCVVGGGYTGLSTALHLARWGYSVVLLEGRRVGWGASGRNGGQLGTGQRRDEADLEKRVGRHHARQLFALAGEASALVHELITSYAIDCDLTPGQLIAAARPAHLDDLRQRAEKLARDYDYPHQRIVPADELPAMLGTTLYHGGCLDPGAAHLHPLNYALGLARAAAAAGVRICEQSMVRSHAQPSPSSVTVTTGEGEVRAAWLVLACNGHLGGLEPRLARRIMPINNFLIATEPLGEPAARALIRDDVCVHDTLFVLHYFRRSPDHRLLFAGGETYTRRFPKDIAGFVRPHLLRVFPQLANVSIDHAWGGTLAVTMNRLPHFGRLAPNVVFAQGYSGHGLGTATLAGRLIAEAIAGTTERFDVFARIPPPPFPGGTLLRWPLLVTGMLWYALRDRL